MIIVKNLIRKFTVGDTILVALNSLSFDVPTGQFLAVTGRSGSGKSTLLYQLSLLDRCDEGVIIVDDEKITDFDEKKRVAFRRDKFGFVFQDYALLPMLTAIENIMLPMLMQGIEHKIAVERAMVSLEKVGLKDRAPNLPNQLSGGQQQRVSIARAIAHRPEILFADEPTANLDTESSKIVFDIFLELNREGQTIVMVTHEPEYAKLAHRNIELLDGKLIKDIKIKKTIKNK